MCMPGVAEEGIRSARTAVTDGFVPPCGCWAPNLGPLPLQLPILDLYWLEPNSTSCLTLPQIYNSGELVSFLGMRGPCRGRPSFCLHQKEPSRKALYSSHAPLPEKQKMQLPHQFWVDLLDWLPGCEATQEWEGVMGCPFSVCLGSFGGYP